MSNTLRALGKLREMIFAGDLPAGSNHLETELAMQLNMSRTPVREALLMLEGQGLLKLQPRKGVRILPISPSDMADIYDVLTELESLSAERAATAGHPPSALAPLEAAIDDMDKAIAAGDLDAWSEADDRFHKELVRLGGNGRVQAIVDMMSDQVRRARAITLALRPLPTKSNEDHRKVFQAIRDGHGDVAGQTHRAHRRHAKEIIVDVLEKHRLRFI
ncbi:GntR family transcriptional regulator [Yoonia maricola]|uniref:GntR family transcriptional regulator n=1 Tax=Yoonia maricola TaxID=420999 RepID=A0A2M8W4C3_9RHOB|nr:GntR family transcriptional regulator [Yoonia maricola]PJI85770.1 GntR family transcriptional regulator [Yoonia maricola]